MSKRRTQTSLIEMAETHNIAISLNRLRDGSSNGYDGRRWRRALYHALTMTDTDASICEKVRIAMGLP